MRSWVSARSFCSSTALSTGDRTGGAGSGVTRGGGGGGAGGRGADGTGRRGSGGGGTARGGATGSGSGARTAGSSAGGASTTGSGCEVGVACTSSGGEGVNHPLIVAHPLMARHTANKRGRNLTERSGGEAGRSSWCPFLSRCARRWSRRAFVLFGKRSRGRCPCHQVGSYNTARTSAPHPRVGFPHPRPSPRDTEVGSRPAL